MHIQLSILLGIPFVSLVIFLSPSLMHTLKGTHLFNLTSIFLNQSQCPCPVDTGRIKAVIQ